MTFFPANFTTKMFAIEKKAAFSREKTFVTEEKLGKFTVTIYKVSEPKRLKFRVVKEKQCKNLKKQKNWVEKAFASR